MGKSIFLVVLLTVFTLACETKKDKAKQLGKELIKEVYDVKIPDKHNKVWTQLEDLYKKGQLTYSKAKPLCDEANEISREFHSLLDKYKKTARARGVYDEFIDILGDLRFKTDCLYSPATGLWTSIDSICSSLESKGFVDTSTWKEALRKFKINYKKAYEIKDECLGFVS